jgi:site-specific recombinase XerD
MSNGIYSNLISQLDKLRRHNRQGSIKTKERYYEAMKRFCRFLSVEYRLEKLSNIASKHLHAYVEHMKTEELSPGTIKTDRPEIAKIYLTSVLNGGGGV